MSWNEIKKLREEGRIDEAFNMAGKWIKKAEESQNMNDLLWAKRGMSWVLYDKLKSTVQELDNGISESSIADFFGVLSQIRELNLGENEELFYEQMAWQVCEASNLFHIKREGQVYLFKNLFNAIEFASFPADKDSYHLLLFRFHRGMKDDGCYTQFIDWWGVENLRPDDYKKRETENGRSFPSMAEQVFTAYLKHTVKAFENGHITRERAVSVIERFEDISRKHPDFNYVHYRVAQLMYLAGDAESAAARFIPFARNNSKQPWVWELFGDLNNHDPDLQISCYCRALLIKTNEDFLTKIRRKLSECLINQHKWDEARTELERYINHRKDRGWKIPETVLNHTGANWYQSATDLGNNTIYYHKHKERSLILLYGDVKEQIVVADYVDRKRNILFYIKNRNETGSFMYKNLMSNPVEGDVLCVKMVPGGGKRKELIVAERTTKVPDDTLLKPFKGTFKRSGLVGFVNNGGSLFVKPETIKKYNLKDGIDIEGTAIASYDKKHDKWGWRVLKVKQ